MITPNSKNTHFFPAGSCSACTRQQGRWKAQSASPFLLPSQAAEGVRLSFSQASSWGGFKEKPCECVTGGMSLYGTDCLNPRGAKARVPWPAELSRTMEGCLAPISPLLCWEVCCWAGDDSFPGVARGWDAPVFVWVLFSFLKLMGDGRRSKDLVVSSLPCSFAPVCLIGRNLSFCSPIPLTLPHHLLPLTSGS